MRPERCSWGPFDTWSAFPGESARAVPGAAEAGPWSWGPEWFFGQRAIDGTLLIQEPDTQDQRRMIFVIVLGRQTDGLPRMSAVIGVIGSVREANVGVSLTIVKHDGACPS